MDIDDPHQSTGTSTFSAFIPLPYRVVFLVGGGILFWALNLHGLHVLGIDPAHALGVTRSPAGYSPLFAPEHNPPTLHSPVYGLFALYALWSALNWLVFHFATTGGSESVFDNFRIMPLVCIVGILCVLFAPMDICYRKERRLFLHAMKRCLFSRRKPWFSDVVMTDILTSYAKVMGDIWISGLMLFPGGSLFRNSRRERAWKWLVPCIMSFPYALRFRQCLLDYFDSDVRSNRQLWNALKYLSAFPVIFLSAMQEKLLDETAPPKSSSLSETVWHGEQQIFRLWLLSVAINTIYSFWWDTVIDWGLLNTNRKSVEDSVSDEIQRAEQLAKPSPTHKFNGNAENSISSQHSSSNFKLWGLRPTLILFPGPQTYYFAILLNLVLRLTWSLKLSPHLHTTAELESGVFLMETLELARRWIWVYFRIEWETVKSRAEEDHQNHPSEFSLVELPNSSSGD